MANSVLDATTKLLPPADAQPKTQPRKADKSFDLVLKKARPKAAAKPAHTDAKPPPKKTGRGGKPKSASTKLELRRRPQEKSADEAKNPQTSEATTDEFETDVPAEPHKTATEDSEESDQQPAIDKQAAENIVPDGKPQPAQSVDADGRNQQPQTPQEPIVNLTIEDEQDDESQPLRRVPKIAVKPVGTNLTKSEEQVQEDVSAIDDQSADATSIDSTNVDEQIVTTDKPQQGAGQHASKSATLHLQSEPPPVALGASTQKQQVQTSTQQQPTDTTTDESVDAVTDAIESAEDRLSDPIASKSSSRLETSLTQAAGASAEQQSTGTAQPAIIRSAQTAAPATPPEVRFAETNHPTMVASMRSQLLPNGGTMHIRLDPPELGALQVRVHMQDGVMTASFQTSNDEATKLLSHSLSQLKHVLESQGVSVDKLHVEQAPRDQQTGSEDGRQQQDASDNPSARQEQQRRELLQRMWRRLANGSDPLDLVA